jgi:hypothetical protein
MSKLNHFLKIFEKDVAPYYQHHEATFDLESFHGRFHILRCLLLVDAIDRFYSSKNIKLDIDKTYYAVLFHDIAREGNGYDEWELESSEACFDYLKKEGFTIQEANEISRLILKETPFTLEGQILYDVDVLDYNRFFWFPQEENLFDQSKLIIASERDLTDVVDVSFRKQLIQLAQDLVVFTENIQVNTLTTELINKVYTYYIEIQKR